MKPGDIVYPLGATDRPTFSPNTLTVFLYIGELQNRHHFSVLFDFEDSFSDYVTENSTPYKVEQWEDTVLSRLADHPHLSLDKIVTYLRQGLIFPENHRIYTTKNLDGYIEILLNNAYCSYLVDDSTSFRPFVSPGVAFDEMLAISKFGESFPNILKCMHTGINPEDYDDENYMTAIRSFEAELYDFFLEHTKSLAKVSLPDINPPTTSL